jgi:hypothetical protein
VRRVVPLIMEFIASDVDAAHLLFGDLDADRSVRNLQNGRRAGLFDQCGAADATLKFPHDIRQDDVAP